VDGWVLKNAFRYGILVDYRSWAKINTLGWWAIAEDYLVRYGIRAGLCDWRL